MRAQNVVQFQQLIVFFFNNKRHHYIFSIPSLKLHSLGVTLTAVEKGKNVSTWRDEIQREEIKRTKLWWHCGRKKKQEKGW